MALRRQLSLGLPLSFVFQRHCSAKDLTATFQLSQSHYRLANGFEKSTLKRVLSYLN
jgi:hypothetical protein